MEKENSSWFKKGHKATDEIQNKITIGIKKSWKSRSGYHGMYGTKFHNVFRSMITRCNGTAGAESIKKYKDKGIVVCEKWKVFHGFYEDMFPSYVEGLTIDRINNSEGYFKENCRWATQKTQQNNRTNNVRLEYNGETKTLSEWAAFLGQPYNSFRLRYYRRFAKGKITLSELMTHKGRKQ